MRKKAQRKFNKAIHKFNRAMREDCIWRGRFEFRQRDARYERFADGSGGIFAVDVRAYDKLTKAYQDFVINTLDGEYQYLGWHMNDFIVKKVKAPVKFMGDFTKVRIPDEVMKWEVQYY